MTTTAATLGFEQTGDGTLLVRLSGRWHLPDGVPSAEPVERELTGQHRPRAVWFEAAGLEAWDTSVVLYLGRVEEVCRRHGVAVNRGGLPAGVQRLLALAEAVPEATDARGEQMDTGVLERIGVTTLEAQESVLKALEFVGDVFISLGRFVVGRARYRRADLWLLIQQTGIEALPVVALVAFLLGLILAFVGAVQLQSFGAAIYVADLVGVAMARDTGALIAAIVMAGRSGAAFAAQLGSMRVNQEIDALATTGISPIEFLVVPRVIALVLMMPLLTLYADVVGILGGLFVGTTMLDLSFTLYFQQTAAAVSLASVVGGVFKGGVYGVLIAVAGCLRGMQSGRSASAVGDAATSAVVTGIVAIIAAAGAFSVIFYVLGI
ncbi:MAG: ABC transporter permease [Gemmatimonadota bacterium]|nr:MAG: ABC transporter permease [Gemmatimonadota bacterium]